jgi:hypothetical protein
MLSIIEEEFISNKPKRLWVQEQHKPYISLEFPHKQDVFIDEKGLIYSKDSPEINSIN